jgi:hypothetical protein
MDEKTTGFTSRKPASGSAQGLSLSVTVSPTLVSATVLMPAIRYPTSPGPSDAIGTRLRRKMPISSTL